eukprot:superscaffoldBa00003047_g15971
MMFSITGEGTEKYVEVEFCGINVVTWSRVDWNTGNSSNLPTHVPVGQGAIRGQSTSLSSCHKWYWRDGEGSRLCFEGQRGRSPALSQ